MRYTIPTETARDAVRPTPLVDVLTSLRDNGVVQSFAIEGDQLVLDMDPGVEIPFVFEDVPTDPALDVTPAVQFDATRAYYARAEAFMRTAAFRRLSKHRRAIWRLHSQGRTKYEIAEELCCPSGSVARAILMIRPQVGLPRTARTIARGRSQNRKSN